jgi:hypothetical protein
MMSLGALSKPLILAIDWHDEMYYGDPNEEGIVGTQPKKDSHHAYRFATFLFKGERLTLAAVPMLDKRVLGYVAILLCRALELRIRVKLLLLDRGFYCIEVARFLWHKVRDADSCAKQEHKSRGGQDLHDEEPCEGKRRASNVQARDYEGEGKASSIRDQHEYQTKEDKEAIQEKVEHRDKLHDGSS